MRSQRQNHRPSVKGDAFTFMTVGVAQAALFPDAAQGGEQSLAALRSIVADPSLGAVEAISTGIGATREAARDLLRQSGFIVDFDAGAALHRSGSSLCSLDPAVRAHAVWLVGEAIDEAAEIGATRVGVISGADPSEELRPAARAALLRSLFELCAYAQASGGLELSLKMADRSVDKRFLIGPTAEGVQVARNVRSKYPGFGVVLNLGHLPLLGEDPEAAVKTAAPVLARVQIGNCVLRDRGHPEFGDSHPQIGVSEGEIGVPELALFLRALFRHGYLEVGGRNVVAFEVRSRPGEDGTGVIAASKAALAAAWAMT